MNKRSPGFTESWLKFLPFPLGWVEGARSGRRRARVVLGTALMALVFCLVWSSSSSNREPAYAGKTADQWLSSGYEDAAQGLQHIGPGAVPFILARLSCEDPRYGSQNHYRRFWNKVPLPLRRFLPKPKNGAFDELHACSLLLELGPGIIPLLCTALHDYNPVVREVSAHTLGSFSRQGRNIAQAASSLTEALQDPVPEVRARAAWALKSASAPNNDIH